MSTTVITSTPDATRRTAPVKDLSTQAIAEDVKIEKYVVPNLTINDVLNVIPAHCFERSFLRSSLYLVESYALAAALVYAAITYIPAINPINIQLPHWILYPALRFAAWSVYGYVLGLVCVGLFHIGHECGHGAFCSNKVVNDIVGFFVHSSIAVPYLTWRASHRHHHAHTSHIGEDQPYDPMTRQFWNLPELEDTKENLEGTRVDDRWQEVLEEIMEFSPLGAIIHNLVPTVGWWLCMFLNLESQQTKKYKLNYPPFRKPMCTNQSAAIISHIGSLAWASAQLYCIYAYGFLHTFRVWVMPHAFYNHWLIMVSYMNHNDPTLPHWDDSTFTFVRGALSTVDRELMGGPGIWGKICNKICARLTHGLAETHVAHHLCARIPHYHAWEAKKHITTLLHKHGLEPQGNPCNYTELVRVVSECKFIEEVGDVRFYKNARGQAARVAVPS